VALVALLAVSLFASEAVMTLLLSDPAYAGNGNGNGGGNGSNAGGNGNGSGGTSPSDDAAAETTVEDPNSILGLRETGVIRPLEDVYKAAEEQFGGQVLDAKLVGSKRLGWSYDLRIVTQDGHVRKARYDATTLALRSLDGQPTE
jgi:hypothetical protein